MWTVTQLARACGLSRSTLLYYESIGLLRPPSRSPANYRRYSSTDLARLEQICLYRNAGLKLADIRAVSGRPPSEASSVLERRVKEIEIEIKALRAHQHAILRLLRGAKSIRMEKDMTKEKWVSIMKAAGFSETDMHRWHVEFERSAPEDHQLFLEYLNIPAGEINSIREWSCAQPGS